MNEKKAKSKVRRIIKYIILILIVVIPISAIMIKYVPKKVAEKRYINNLKYGLNAPTKEEWIESLKNQQSDIDGKTLYDLYEMGLVPAIGADSDYDGLTDKEEIEVYHTDPLKASTSGDLYSDSYKVLNDMDLTKYYEYKEEQVFSHNECEDVSLSAVSPTDFYAVVTDVTERFSLEKYNVHNIYKGYEIYNYGGIFNVDLNNIIISGQDEKDIAVYLFKGEYVFDETIKPVTVDFIIKNRILTLDEKLDDNEIYYIFIVEKPSFKERVTSYVRNNIFGINDLDDNTGDIYADGTEEEQGNQETLIEGCILTDFFEQIFSIKKTNLKIYCTEDTSDDALDTASRHLNNIFCKRLKGTDVKPYKKISKAALKWKMFLYKYTPLNIFLTSGEKSDEHWWNIFWVAYIPDKNFNSITRTYGSEEEDTDTSRSENVHHYNNDSRKNVVNWKHAHCNFQIVYDELQFQNFESEYCEGGNCAGLVHLTAMLYNKGYYSGAGTYKGIKWELSIDSANKTLLDKQLYDYKTWDFIDNNSDRYSNYLKTDYLSRGELEFVKMVAAANYEINDKIPLSDYMGPNGCSELFDWKTINNLTSYMDQDKVIECGLWFNNPRYAHSILLIDYTWTKYGELIFVCYDPNFPCDSTAVNTHLLLGRPVLWFKKKIDKAGKETYLYCYNPIRSSDYYSCNFGSLNGAVFHTEDFKVLNYMPNGN